MTHQFTTKLQKVKSSLLWNYHFVVPKEVSDLLIDENRRVVCKINDAVTFQCGLFPKGDGVYFINLNAEIRRKLKVEQNDELNIILSKDKSKYGIPIPNVFEELLFQDAEGESLFHALTPGKQRSLLYIIDKPKNEKIKLEKGLVVLDFLKESNGKLDFKELNAAFKNSRFR